MYYFIYIYHLRTIHLYIGQQFRHFKQVVKTQELASRYDHLNPTSQIGLNMWLTHTTTKENSETLVMSLKTCPLRFDSHVFEFYENGKGKNIDYNFSVLNFKISILVRIMYQYNKSKAQEIFVHIHLSYNHILENGTSSMNVREYYKIDEQSQNIITLNYGQWDSLKGITVAQPNIWKRRSDLQEYTFRYLIVCCIW